MYARACLIITGFSAFVHILIIKHGLEHKDRSYNENSNTKSDRSTGKNRR